MGDDDYKRTFKALRGHNVSVPEGEQEFYQRLCDEEYMKSGPCCAGCDWWRGWYYHFGECTRTAPMAGFQRWAMINTGAVYFDVPEPGPGHIMTPPTYHCGEFKDEFDWQALPTQYLKRIGFPGKSKPAPPPKPQVTP